MKRTLVLLLAAMLALPAPDSWGMVVSDPTSYGYYVQQIKEATKHTQEMLKQVETMGGVLTQAEKLNRQVMGNYNRAVGLANKVQNVKNRLSGNGKSPSTMGGYLRAWHGTFGQARGAAGTVGSVAGTTGNVLDGSVDSYVDARQILDENFEDPRTRKETIEGMPNYGPDQQYHLSQTALKDAVAEAEISLQSMPEKLDTLEGLARDIDSTENIKDSTDLQNRFLAEILKALYELIAITAKVGEAQSLQHYQGVDEGTMAARIEAAEEAANRPKLYLHEEELAARGIRRNEKGYYDMDVDDMKKAAGIN